MIKFKILASGSKGNCTLVETDNTKFLIDAGISYQRIKHELEMIGVSLEELTGILITHIHSDHTKGLKVLLNKTNLKVYIPKDMKKELLTIVTEDRLEFISDIENFIDLEIELIYTSHDTECSVGYIMTSSNESIVYITDTGYINKKYLEKIKNKSAYILESNHDEEMLMDGPYPYYLKQRVISDYGHLSNKTTAKYLSTIVGDKTKYIILAHLSEINNTKEIAYNETEKRMIEISYNGKILIAEQEKSTDLIEV